MVTLGLRDVLSLNLAALRADCNNMQVVSSSYRRLVAAAKMAETKVQSALALARQQHVLRPRDLDALRIPRDYLDRLRRRGVLERVGRGLYVLADAGEGEQRLLAEAAKRVPQGVICLLSALSFHGLIARTPHEVWMALPVKARLPRADHPPLRVVRFSGESLTAGIQFHTAEGVELKVYGVAKTLADCFKYRNKIGLETALEALRECWRRQACTMDDLWRAAGTCRMTNVMRPYLESLA
jgi:predicted transcriptional regulator of viral defense system